MSNANSGGGLMDDVVLVRSGDRSLLLLSSMDNGWMVATDRRSVMDGWLVGWLIVVACWLVVGETDD